MIVVMIMHLAPGRVRGILAASMIWLARLMAPGAASARVIWLRPLVVIHNPWSLADTCARIIRHSGAPEHRQLQTFSDQRITKVCAKKKHKMTYLFESAWAFVKSAATSVHLG